MDDSIADQIVVAIVLVFSIQGVEPVRKLQS
jgi:hypothetical protein